MCLRCYQPFAALNHENERSDFQSLLLFFVLAGLGSVLLPSPSPAASEVSRCAWAATTSAFNCCHHPSPTWFALTALEAMSSSLVVCLAHQLVWMWYVQVGSLCTQARKYVYLLLMSHVALQGNHSASGMGMSHARTGLSPRLESAPSLCHDGIVGE